MTRIDLTARDLHRLINPVLPHASTDAESPHLNTVYLQVTGNVLYAVATDHYTLASTRHPLEEVAADFDITIDRADIAAALKLFPHTKDHDPKLTLIVDKFPMPIGNTASIDARGLRIDAEDGTRLILHDRSAPDVKPFARWRVVLGNALHQPRMHAAPAVMLTPSMLARWSKAAGKGERLMMFVGRESADLVLFVVEDHFAGVWKPVSALDGDEATSMHRNPWLTELLVPVAGTADDAD